MITSGMAVAILVYEVRSQRSEYSFVVHNILRAHNKRTALDIASVVESTRTEQLQNADSATLV